ncbi:MAG: hypothetical protein ABIA47_01815 [bacterium]
MRSIIEQIRPQPGAGKGQEQVIGFESTASQKKRIQSRERKPDPTLQTETGLSLKKVELPKDKSLATLE